ncbi:MAG: hypothetical protein QF567_01190 [Candidatus Pacearchaeota archaeon]|jgi:hypothetical protein|nr:hypothetical protein [Candidatus Pacearchaeota archaeon]
MVWTDFITNHTPGIAITLIILVLIYKFIYLPLANEGIPLGP